MKKKLTAVVLCTVFLFGSAAAALGATDSSKLAEIKSLAQQMLGIQKQIIDKEVETGLITRQQSDTLKQFAEQREQAQEQALANGQVVGSCPGLGVGRRTEALKNGTFGSGSCGMFGGRWGGPGRRGASTAGGSNSSY